MMFLKFYSICTYLTLGWILVVAEVDLAPLRSPEEIALDTEKFMNNGEWELLSVLSHYWKLNLGNKDYAHVQFNVRNTFYRNHLKKK